MKNLRGQADYFIFLFFFRNTIFDLNNQYWKIHLINPQQKLINRLLY